MKSAKGKGEEAAFSVQRVAYGDCHGLVGLAMIPAVSGRLTSPPKGRGTFDTADNGGLSMWIPANDVRE